MVEYNDGVNGTVGKITWITNRCLDGEKREIYLSLFNLNDTGVRSTYKSVRIKMREKRHSTLTFDYIFMAVCVCVYVCYECEYMYLCIFLVGTFSRSVTSISLIEI